MRFKGKGCEFFKYELSCMIWPAVLGCWLPFAALAVSFVSPGFLDRDPGGIWLRDSAGLQLGSLFTGITTCSRSAFSAGAEWAHSLIRARPLQSPHKSQVNTAWAKPLVTVLSQPQHFHDSVPNLSTTGKAVKLALNQLFLKNPKNLHFFFFISFFMRSQLPTAARSQASPHRLRRKIISSSELARWHRRDLLLHPLSPAIGCTRCF